MLYINQTWQKGSGEKFSSLNPANNEKIWEGFSASSEDIEQTIAAAQKAFQDWSKLSFEKRLSYLKKFQVALSEKKDHLAECISKEVGKPKWESLTEVAAMIAKLDISVKAYKDRCAVRESAVRGTKSYTRFKPHGVVAVFGPFNFPGHLANGHIIPALLAGNVVIFKPSELAPLVAEETLRIWESANLPAGVLQLLQGGKKNGEILAQHSHLDGLFFTGSSKVGSILNETFAKHPEKILALEMGGNNPLVVHDIKNIQAAAYTTIQSAFITAGQRCTCARRLIVVEGSTANQFLETLRLFTKNLTVGDYKKNPEPFMGPVIHNQAAQNVINVQNDLIANGAKSILESHILKENTGLISPGLIDVTNVAKTNDNECFGPLLQIIRVSDFDEAIHVANQTRYGLAAGLLSDNPKLYEKFWQDIKAGIVNWNNQLTGAASSSPFGGVGLSGNHRPSAYFAADYCTYPVASLEIDELKMPDTLLPGIKI